MMESILTPFKRTVSNMDANKFNVGAALLLCVSLTLEADVYRWVDENGDVHYTESLPPDFEDRKHDVIDKRGIVVKEDLSLKRDPPKPKPKVEDKGQLPRDSSGMRRPEPLYSPAELQRRLDSMLLLRYTTEQELVDAMNVEIDQLAYDKRLIGTSLSSVRNTYRANIRKAADRQRAGIVVPADMSQKLAGLRRRLEENEMSLSLLDQRETEIRELFDTERTRYRRLVLEREAEAES